MRDFFVREYSVPIEKENKKILLLSDIHYCNKKEQKYLSNILEEIKKVKYDYLCISGDLLDNGKIDDTEWLVEWLSSLAKLSKVIIGIGNHEQASDAKKHEYAFDKAFYKKINKIKNIKVLDNDTFIDGNIRFIGVTLPLDYYYKYHESKTYFVKYINNLFPKSYSDKYNILLCHTPIPLMDENVIRQIPFFSNISLVLCGHMHGGLLPKCLWKLGMGRGLVGPFHRMFPKGAYGMFRVGEISIIVSTGITKISQVHLLSGFNSLFRKELTLISLQQKNR